ncbi:hypothetical protein ACLQ25_17000 [Micromonospora sp. DT44]|uniref:hypothetical protein n=1 Tax=Micromonospora sp. DT44 TaxID=3393439 RepID=UPI003CF0C6D2
MNDSDIVGLEYMTNADAYQGFFDSVPDSHTFYRPVEKGTAIRFSTPADLRDYRKELESLKKAVTKGSDPGLKKYQRDSLGKVVKEMKRDTPLKNANDAFNMMWHLRVNVGDYPTSGPTFQKIAAFYNLHSPQLVHDKHHRPPTPHGIEPSRSRDEVVASGDPGPKVGWREKAQIGTDALREVALMNMTGAQAFSSDGGESYRTQVRLRINDAMARKKGPGVK